VVLLRQLRAHSLNSAYILTGFGLLLCGAFVDSSRSPLLPVLSKTFGVNYQQVSLFLVVGYFTSVLFTSMLIPLTRRIGARRTGLLACGVSAFMGLFAQFVHTFPMALVLGVIVACSASCLGAMSNVFVIKGSDLSQRGRFFSGLHTMYGLGAQAAPIVAAWTLSHFSWNTVFTVAAIPPVLLGLFIFLKVPAEEPRTEPAKSMEKQAVPQPVEPAFRWFSIGGLVVLISAFYVAGEVLASNWMITYLVESRGFTVEQAAPYLSGYFWCIAITRALCFLVHSSKVEKVLMWGSMLCSLIFFCVGLLGFPICFALAGLLGPFFPLMLARMTRAIPEQAESVSIRVMAGMQLTLAVCNLSAGALIDRIGAERTYVLPALFMAATIALTAILLRYRTTGHSPAAFRS
jgi:fucose permease